MSRILMAVDFSAVTDQIVATVVPLAQQTDAEVVILFVVPSVLDPQGWESVHDRQADFAQQYRDEFQRLTKLVAQVEGADSMEIRALRRRRKPSSQLDARVI